MSLTLSLLKKQKNLLPADGEIFYIPQFLNSEESKILLLNLVTRNLWKHEPITLFGKKILQPRLTAWVGDIDKSYTYSGKCMIPTPWFEPLLSLKYRLETELQSSFSNVLMNLYRTGQDSMGWHRDNEKELGPEPVIASISLGAQRDFYLRHRKKLYPNIKIALENGSLLIMRGQTQDFWDHCLPKRLRCQEARVNLTFRQIIPIEKASANPKPSKKLKI
jgi:alkylated DNA repair dioxygenase AlkB